MNNKNINDFITTKTDKEENLIIECSGIVLQLNNEYSDHSISTVCLSNKDVISKYSKLEECIMPKVLEANICAYYDNVYSKYDDKMQVDYSKLLECSKEFMDLEAIYNLYIEPCCLYTISFVTSLEERKIRCNVLSLLHWYLMFNFAGLSHPCDSVFNPIYIPMNKEHINIEIIKHSKKNILSRFETAKKLEDYLNVITDYDYRLVAKIIEHYFGIQHESDV